MNATQTDVVCFDFKHNAKKTWQKIDMQWQTQIIILYVFPEKITFLSKLLSFTVAKSLVTNGA